MLDSIGLCPTNELPPIPADKLQYINSTDMGDQTCIRLTTGNFGKTYTHYVLNVVYEGN